MENVPGGCEGTLLWQIIGAGFERQAEVGKWGYQ
jgi:hypothetical protein